MLAREGELCVYPDSCAEAESSWGTLGCVVLGLCTGVERKAGEGIADCTSTELVCSATRTVSVRKEGRKQGQDRDCKGSMQWTSQSQEATLAHSPGSLVTAFTLGLGSNKDQAKWQTLWPPMAAGVIQYSTGWYGPLPKWPDSTCSQAVNGTLTPQ